MWHSKRLVDWFRSGSAISARRTRRSVCASPRAFERLETRQMLSITALYNAGTMTEEFTGTGTTDLLEVSMTAANTISFDIGSGTMTQSGVSTVTFAGAGGATRFIIHGLPTTSNTFTFAPALFFNAVATPTIDFIYDGVQKLFVDGGNAGDTYNVQEFATETHILGGTGNDTVNVSSDAGGSPGNQGNLEGIFAPLDVDLGLGSNTMVVSDYGETTLANSNVTIGGGEIDNFAGPTNNIPIQFAATGGSLALSLIGSNTLPDKFTVSELDANIPLSLQGGGGDSTFVVGTGDLSQIHSPVAVVGGSGTNDQLTVDDSTRSVAVNYVVTGEVDVGGEKIIQSFAGVEKMQINGTQGINHFAVTPNANTEISINGEAPSTTPGDSLSVNLVGTTGAMRTTGAGGSGQWTFAGNNPKPVDYTNIEQSGIEDILAYGAAASKTSQPLVKIVDAATGLATGLAMSQVMAYASTFKGGVHVALGDVNGDGIPDLIVAPGRGLEPTIKVYNLLTGTLIEQFDVYSAKFRGGVNVALGDLNHDGLNDLVVSPTQGNAVIQTFTNTGMAAQPFGPLGATPPNTTAPVLTPSTQFLAFSPKFLGGATVVVNDVLLTGAGAQIIVGSGPGMAATVDLYPGNANNSSVKTTLAPLMAFNPFAAGFRGGVNVASMGALVTVGAGVGGNSELQEWAILPGAPPTASLVFQVASVFPNKLAPLQVVTNSTDLVFALGNDAPSSLVHVIGIPQFSNPLQFYTQLLADPDAAFNGGFYLALDVNS
ncbi:MAG TPA: VCBS repeat-containing protein [Pirellulales bacterium]|nr:VCBS repeat-containing protein [Pirellulales bacterium]